MNLLKTDKIWNSGEVFMVSNYDEKIQGSAAFPFLQARRKNVLTPSHPKNFTAMQNVEKSTVSQRHLQNNFKRGRKIGIKPTKGDEEFTSTNISDKKSFIWWMKIHDWSRKLVNYISSFTHQSLALRRISGSVALNDALRFLMKLSDYIWLHKFSICETQYFAVLNILVCVFPKFNSGLKIRYMDVNHLLR